MSCHQIGEAMNSVVDVVFKLYDANELSQKTAVTLIRSLRNGVNYCDGNEYEAVESVRKCRCGKCLKALKPGEDRIYSLDDLSSDDYFKILDQEDIAYADLCVECTDAVLNDYFHDADAGRKFRKKVDVVKPGESEVEV